MTLVEQLTDIKTQIGKATSEIVQKISDLENALGQISPEAQQILDDIKAQTQVLDDIVPDAPAPTPEG